MCAGTGKRTRQPPPPVVTADPTPGPKPCLGQAHFASGRSWRDGRTLPAQLLSQPFGPAPASSRELQRLRIKTERLELPAPFGGSIAKSLDPDAAWQIFLSAILRLKLSAPFGRWIA